MVCVCVHVGVCVHLRVPAHGGGNHFYVHAVGTVGLV